MEAYHGSWGERIITFQWDAGLTTILYLLPHQRCSWHCHDRCFNQFYVISGKLGVRTDKGHTTELTARQVFTVEPDIYHEFETYDEGAVVQEIAFVRYDPSDIKRERLGGPTNGGNE